MRRLFLVLLASPDGTKLVFNAPTESSQADLFVMDADGSNLRHLLVTKGSQTARRSCTRLRSSCF